MGLLASADGELSPRARKLAVRALADELMPSADAELPRDAFEVVTEVRYRGEVICAASQLIPLSQLGGNAREYRDDAPRSTVAQ